MAVMTPKTDALTPNDLVAMGMLSGGFGGDPLRAAGKAERQSSNLAETIVAQTVTESVVASGAVRGLESLAFALEGDRREDPTYNPYEILTDDYAAEHPYMIEEFASGRVLDLPNWESFYWLQQTKGLDWQMRQAVSHNSMAANMAAMVPGQVLDALTLGGILKVLGLSGSAAAVGNWAKSGSAAVRVGKGAALGAMANELQEIALSATNPDRNVDELQAHLMAIGAGGLFGGGLTAIAAGAGKLRPAVTSRRLRGLSKQLTQTMELPEVRKGLDEVQQMVDGDRELLSGLLDGPVDGPRTVAVLDHPATRNLLKRAKAKWGDSLIIAEHPQQAMVDWIVQLQELEGSLKTATPAKMSGPLQKYADLLSAWAPGSKLRRSPSAVARQAGRLLFDDTTALTESVESPVTHAVRASAEALRWNYDHWRDLTLLRVNQALDDHIKAREGSIRHALASGEVLEVSSRLHRRRFYRAVVGYLRQLEEASRNRRPAPDAPRAIRRAAAAVREYAQNMGKEAVSVKLLGTVDADRIYIPRRWRGWVIAQRRKEFTEKLIAQWRRNREVDFLTGKAIDPDQRVIMDKVIAHGREHRLGREGLTGEQGDALKALRRQLGEEPMTEGIVRAKMGDDVLARYHRDVEQYFTNRAEGTADVLTDMSNAHGVAQEIVVSEVFEHRTLEIDETDFADFLEDDLGSILSFYHRRTSGKIAARLAIKRGINDWGPLVKRLTGKDLADESYDPQLVIEAVKRDFQNWIDVAGKLRKPKMLANLEAARDLTDRILTRKLAELEGQSVFHDPAVDAGWMLFAKRSSLNFPYMACLGKMTVSAICDVAGLVFYRGLTPKRLGKVLRSISLFRKIPRRGLEGLDVALNDSIRSLRAASLGDVVDVADTRMFGTGLKGRSLARADAAVNWLARKFTEATLMNRWNSNMKRTTAHLVIQEIIAGSRRMVRASEYMQRGMAEAAAIRKAGLIEADAVRLNRLGFNADRSRRLLDTLYEYGLDVDGNRPWRGSRAAFDNHKAGIFPELHSWWNKDRDLFETFTAAVNSEVQNIIIEPKMLSRPLMNATWLGKVFNQFQSFAFAWGNQFSQMAVQRPAIEKAQYIIWALGLGAMSAAIHNQLSGRRSFTETAELWQRSPLAMVYESIDRAGLFGWIARPLGMMEKTPWGPARALGAEKTAQMTAQIQRLPGIMGPFADYVDRLLTASHRAIFDDEIDRRTLHSFRVLTPFNNLWAVTAAERLAEDAGLIDPYEP